MDELDKDVKLSETTESDESSKEDYDFDFSKYEAEEEQEYAVDSIKDKPPTISGLKSRYSNFGVENEHLGFMKQEVLKYSIKTASGTQELNELWKHYGSLYTYWDCFKDIAGEAIQKEMRVLFKKCRLVLKHYQDFDEEIPYEKCHRWLLYVQSKVFRLRQLFNLGFEVQKSYRGEMQKSKAKIIEG